MSRIISIFMIFLMLHLQGCAATVYRWSEFPPERDNLSQSERQLAVERLQIRDFVGIGAGVAYGRIKLADDKEYSLNAFTPMILKISPQSEKYIRELEFNDQMGIWLLVAELSVVMASYLGRTTLLEEDYLTTLENYSALNWGGLVAMGVVGLGIGWLIYRGFTINQMLKETYNADLKRYYLPETSSLDQAVPTPSLELIEKTEQAVSLP